MKKFFTFLKTNTHAIIWTIEYAFMLWLILKYVFRFDMFSHIYWHKFFHSTLHGFAGFVLTILIYSAIPIYIASVVTVYKTKKPIIEIPFIKKFSEKISNIFKHEKKSEEKKEPEQTSETTNEDSIEYPDDLPTELKIPFMRAKQNVSIQNTISAYNRGNNTISKLSESELIPGFDNVSDEAFPIPTDFDISNNTSNENIPTFSDINFYETESETNPNKFENATTKYFDEKHIKYEIVSEFVKSDKYIIYEHNDEDFWIMDEDNWFASGKQKESPIPELLKIAEQNKLIPVLYLKSQNIMEIENTTKHFEFMGIKIIKQLDELD